MKKIEVRTQAGYEEVRVYLTTKSGNLAVTPMLSGEPGQPASGWVITHVATGTAIVQCPSATLFQVRVAAKELDAFDFSSTDPRLASDEMVEAINSVSRHFGGQGFVRPRDYNRLRAQGKVGDWWAAEKEPAA